MNRGFTFVVVTSLAFVDKRICHTHTRCLLNSSNGFRQRVAIVRIAFTQSHTHNPAVAICCRHRDLLAKLITLVRLPFAVTRYLAARPFPPPATAV
jgi:hypothetical protein